MTKKKSTKALVLFSGGLDSILAAKILETQGIEVTALVFTSHFFDAKEANKSAREEKIKLRIEDISEKHFAIVKKPQFGRGSGMNPCIDCHLLMLKEAEKIMKKEKFDFIATGEVLGQRPISQSRGVLELIEKKAGLAGKIVRPLSARMFNFTGDSRLEKIVDFEKLYGISGRGRQEQIRLAREFGVKYYPTPAGGCILTDKEYSKKLQDLLRKSKKISSLDIKLLRIGRHFWAGKNGVILGRNHEENLLLLKLRNQKDLLLGLKSNLGPLALVRGRKTKKALEVAREKILYYGRRKLKKGERKIVEY